MTKKHRITHIKAKERLIETDKTNIAQNTGLQDCLEQTTDNKTAEFQQLHTGKNLEIYEFTRTFFFSVLANFWLNPGCHRRIEGESPLQLQTFYTGNLGDTHVTV